MILEFMDNRPSWAHVSEGRFDLCDIFKVAFWFKMILNAIFSLKTSERPNRIKLCKYCKMHFQFPYEHLSADAQCPLGLK